MWQARSLITVFVIGAVIGAGANDLEGFGDEFDDLPIHADPAPGTDQQQPLQHATTVDSGASRISGLEWDEDEFEGFQDSSTASFQGDGQQQKAEQPSAPRRPRGPMFVRQEHYYYEIAALVFLVFYGLNVWYGKSVNEKLALAWARTFCSPGGVFDKNFSLLGPGDSDHNELLMKESQSTYKFYASGRRYCQGLLATLDLRARQDAVSLLWYLVDGRKDLLDIEVYMNDHMPPLVMAVATTKLARQFQRDREDVKTFTRQIEPGRDRMPHWPREKLVVLAESSSTFYDIVNHQALEAVFGQEGFAEMGKYFRYMLISSENTDSSYRKVLRFSFVLPDASRMEAISKLLVAVTHVIDIVGNYQLNPDAKKRAERLRAEQEKKSFAESRRAREEELQKKKAEKLLAEQDRAARMGPEAQRKWEEKEAKKAAKKAVRVKMIRS